MRDLQHMECTPRGWGATATACTCLTLYASPVPPTRACSHTTTFGGNPMSLAAAIAAMQVTVKEGLPANAAARGDWLVARISALASGRYPHLLKEVRGRGLMLGLEFHTDEIGFAFSKGVFARGCLLSGTLAAARVLRVEPPLTITPEECAIVMDRFEDTLAAMHAAGLGDPTTVPSSMRATHGEALRSSCAAADTAAVAKDSEVVVSLLKPATADATEATGTSLPLAMLPPTATAVVLASEATGHTAPDAAAAAVVEEEVEGVTHLPPGVFLGESWRRATVRGGLVYSGARFAAGSAAAAASHGHRRRTAAAAAEDLAAGGGSGLCAEGRLMAAPFAAGSGDGLGGSATGASADTAARGRLARTSSRTASPEDSENDVSSLSSTSTESGGMDTEASEDADDERSQFRA